jgi:hypothetical protein
LPPAEAPAPEELALSFPFTVVTSPYASPDTKIDGSLLAGCNLPPTFQIKRKKKNAFKNDKDNDIEKQS